MIPPVDPAALAAAREALELMTAVIKRARRAHQGK